MSDKVIGILIKKNAQLGTETLFVKVCKENQLLQRKLDHALQALKQFDDFTGADCYDIPELCNFAIRQIEEME